MPSISTQLSSKRLLKRNPSGSTKLNGAVGIELGRMLELEIGDRVVRASKTGKSRMDLLWFTQWKALILFEDVKKSANTQKNLRELTEERPTARAKTAFEKWAQREAEQSYDLTFAPGARKWYGFGQVRRVDYWSDKWGRDDEYTHKFGPGVKLYVLMGRKSAMWVMRGGKLNVTRRGIVG